MLYAFARKVWSVVKWIWTALIIVFLATYAANLAVVQTKDISKTSLIDFAAWLYRSGPTQIYLLSGLVGFAAITFVAGTITAIDDYKKGGKAVRKYLHSVITANQDLNPEGFSRSQPLISVNVPLDSIFIHLRVVADRPMHDAPNEQLKVLEELRQHSDQNSEQLGEHIRRLLITWYSQMGQSLFDMQQKQNVAIEEVIQQLKMTNPVAVILGGPGSGKSTTLRWLTYHMARANLLPFYHRWLNLILHILDSIFDISLTFGLSLKFGYQFPSGLSPKQIPILLQISDYAKRLSQPGNEDFSFEQFFVKQFNKIHPSLPDRLLDEIDRGRCLLLFDGLDEVASESLRRRVREDIYSFIARHSTHKLVGRHFNRFVITSRIVGYEAGTLNKYTHYTLLDLEDEQIEQFLTNWCPAIENFLIRSSQAMKKLTHQQEKRAKSTGFEYRDSLLEAIKSNANIRRLAINPLMLAILAFIQRSNRTLPHHRVELYQIITDTLFESWNQATNRKIFTGEEIVLAKRLLSELAYCLHSGNPLLTEKEVKTIAQRSMSEFYSKPFEQFSELTIQQFIETIRSSSGIFVETGQGLFSFMHRTFQEYFVALYLLRKPPEALKQFIIEHFHLADWWEPLLLAIAYKSRQASSDEWEEASELIQAVANTRDAYDTVLQRSLLFAANSMIDCSVFSINHSLQQDIANRLFDLYADFYGAGRFTQLQQEIERVALLWLRGQPYQNGQKDMWYPLLDAWRTVLCTAHDPIRQEGATHLLAAIAINLPSCSPSVLLALVPPLIQLTDLSDIPCPSEMRTQLSQISARPGSIKVEEYAFIALRLLDAHGPAGWLHTEWLKWYEERPELVERLTNHAFEIEYFLTPAALPHKSDSLNWEKQRDLIDNWKKSGQRNPRNLQLQMLHASTAARFPHAYLFWGLLLNEETEESKSLPWRITWDEFLKKEMVRGRAATYQACLSLRLLLSKENKHRRYEFFSGGKIAEYYAERDHLKLHGLGRELIEALATPPQMQAQAMIAITRTCLRYALNIPYEQYLLEMSEYQKPEDLTTDQFIGTDKELHQREYEAALGQKRYLLGLPHLIEVREKQDISYVLNILKRLDKSFPDTAYLLKTRDVSNIRDMFKVRDMVDIQDILHMRSMEQSKLVARAFGTVQSPVLQYLLGITDSYHILSGNLFLFGDFISILCKMLEQEDGNPSLVLLTLYSIVTVFDTIPSTNTQQIKESIQAFRQQTKIVTKECDFYLAAIMRQIDNPTFSTSTIKADELNPPSDLIDTLNALKQQPKLTKSQVQQILTASIDTRQLTEEQRKAVNVGTVQEFAWELLTQQFSFEPEALPIIIQTLEDDNAIACNAAALLLQTVSTFSQSTREEAAQKILEMLRGDNLPLRSIDSPEYGTWRLDDVLYETLKVLIE